jgi:hypothetical protein
MPLTKQRNSWHEPASTFNLRYLRALKYEVLQGSGELDAEL